MNDQVSSVKPVSGILQNCRNAANEIAPVFSRRTVQSIERQADRLAVVAGISLQGTVLAFCRGDPSIELQGSGHDEAVVVVGVLADHIDAAGCAENTRAGPKHFPKTSRQRISGRA